MAKKKTPDTDSLLNDAARAIGSTLGTLSGTFSAKAESLSSKAKSIRMPSLPPMPSLPSKADAKNLVSRVFGKKAAAKKAAAKKAAAKKAAPEKASAKPRTVAKKRAARG